MDTVISAQRQAGTQQVVVILLGSSLTIMGAVMILPILPKMGAELGPLSAHANVLMPLVATSPALAIAVFAPVAGWLVDRFGRKRLLILATLAYVMSGFAPSQLHTLEDILLSRLLLGIAEAFILTSCTTLIGDYWQEDERQKYVNRQMILIGLIGSLFFMIGGRVGEASWRHPFYLYLLPLLLVPFMLKLLWEPVWKVHTPSTSDVPAERGAWQAIVAASFLAFAGMAGIFIVPVQAPAILGNLGINSTTQIGIAIGIGPLANVLGALLWPFVRKNAGVALTNAILLGLIATGLILLVQARSYSSFILAIIPHSIGA
ncbi:MFS transporter, partial [Noviherbaspirillum sp.]|uniref:MFS transporter n=1 Tax=Noviherbaspirillum sp. TaxID=1926288 RepID=UPI002FE3FE45